MKKVIEICSICVSAYNQGGGAELTPVRSQHSATRWAGVLPVRIRSKFFLETILLAMTIHILDNGIQLHCIKPTCLLLRFPFQTMIFLSWSKEGMTRRGLPEHYARTSILSPGKETY
jgi:hypothetical protein